MKKIPITLPEGRSYSVIVAEGLLDRAGEFLASLSVGGDPFVVTDRNVAGHYGDRLLGSLKKGGFPDPYLHVVEPGERSKALSVWSDLLDSLVDYARTGRRKPFVLAFGGGVVGDLAGFAAAAYRRGIPVAQFATTVIAMTDSAIGGKTGVDHPKAKNLVGAFHQPKAVLVDPSVLATLDNRELLAGIAEVIKYGVIRDPELFELLKAERSRILSREAGIWTDLVVRCAMIKAWYVEQDEFDRTGIRAELNFGHTIGHGWEASVAYGEEIRHGEAVAAGMIGACRIAARMGLCNDSLGAEIEDLVAEYGLPTRIAGGSVDDILAALRLDKKNVSGRHRFILPKAIGKVEVVDGIEETLIRETVEEMQG